AMWVVLVSMCTEPALATIEPPKAAPAESAVPTGSLTVSAGTRVSMTLSTQLTAKDTKPGMAVRAVTAFPVAAGSQVAIPAGTFVEGTVVSVKKRSSSGPRVQIHFTNLLYANGYSVPLDATNLQAEVIAPDSGYSAAAIQPADSEAFLYAANMGPTP